MKIKNKTTTHKYLSVITGVWLDSVFEYSLGNSGNDFSSSAIGVESSRKLATEKKINK